MKSIYIVLFTFLLFTTLLGGCKKYLDAKSDQSLVVVSNLQDLQSLLDSWSTINFNNPSADEVSSDEYFLDNTNYSALVFDQQRNMYTWQPNNLFFPFTNNPNDWTLSYNNVYVANTVLDNMNKVVRNSSNAFDWDNIKGQALFLRAYSFYKIASIWALAYDSLTATADLGIPLRLNSNFNEQSTRSSIAGTYNQIVQDLKISTTLLSPASVHVYRSAKPAAYALLAKTYLSMRKYNLAGLYADSCMQLYSTLVDYNGKDSTSSNAFGQFNKEILYDSRAGGLGANPISITRARIDTVLYSSYSPNDLRRPLFFSRNSDGTYAFKGSYEGISSRFNGIATDEILLTRAECYARTGNTAAAMNDLNTLLLKRYKTGTFILLTATGPDDALSKILIDRRKELVMRGTRWMDIKRLNKEGANISLKRIVNGQLFSLLVNDLRFALPIPEDIIALSSMQRNPR